MLCDLSVRATPETRGLSAVPRGQPCGRRVTLSLLIRRVISVHVVVVVFIFYYTRLLLHAPSSPSSVSRFFCVWFALDKIISFFGHCLRRIVEKKLELIGWTPSFL